MKELGMLAAMWMLLAVTAMADTGYLKATRVPDGTTVRISSASVDNDPSVIVVSSSNARPSLICFNNGPTPVALGPSSVSSTSIANTGVILLSSATVNFGSYLGELRAVGLNSTATEIRCMEGLTQ